MAAGTSGICIGIALEKGILAQTVRKSYCLCHFLTFCILKSQRVFGIVQRCVPVYDDRQGQKERDKEMAEILVKAASFVAIIILGYVLRRKGLFKQEDFHVLSKIVLKITLPAAIVSNFSGIDLKPSMLLLSALGLGGGVLLITSSLVMNAGKSRNERAFGVIPIYRAII